MMAEVELNGTPGTTENDKGSKHRDNYHLVNDDQAESEGYGCLGWRPSFLQFVTRGGYFCAFLCLIVFADAFNSGTFGSAVTSLETRYQLPSSQLGFINSMYEFASMVLVLFVVYYAGTPTSNRPLWVGLGSMLMGVGAVIALLPQFLFGTYVPLVDRSGTGNDSSGSAAICTLGASATGFCSDGAAAADREGNNAAFVMIICGMIIVGLGWTPVMALGMSYIDDNAKTGTSAMYIGYVQSMFGFGKIAGFLIGGVTVRKWVDFYQVDPAEYGIGRQDAQWVGAWWIGLIISATLYSLSGLPMIGFPRTLPKNHGEAHHEFMGKASQHGKTNEADVARKPKMALSKKKAALKSITDMPARFWQILKNPLYLSITMAFVTEFAAQLGLNIFFPKYLETEFGMTSSNANLVTGAVLVPAAALGSILGGIIVKRFKTKAEGSCKVALVLSVIAMFLLLITFGIGCKTVPTAGVTTPYSSSSETGLNRTTVCNVRCGCNDDLFKPVCGSDGITYVTPCHAGCIEEHDNGTFTSCSCIDNAVEVGTAVDGSCSVPCKTLVPFLIISFLVVIISGAEEIPQTLISMRCVSADSKALSLGVRAILMRLLGAIPAPLIYGAAIDTACRLWQTDCGSRGSCFVYDLAVFRYAFLGVNFLFKILTVIFYLISWWLIRRQRLSNKKGGDALPGVMVGEEDDEPEGGDRVFNEMTKSVKGGSADGTDGGENMSA